MKVKQAAHECVYGVLAEGEEITETLIAGNIGYPEYKVNGEYYIGLLQDYLDRRRTSLATHYDFCPYCGKKLDYRKIKQIAKDCEGE